jgi:hypothetical protein
VLETSSLAEQILKCSKIKLFQLAINTFTTFVIIKPKLDKLYKGMELRWFHNNHDLSRPFMYSFLVCQNKLAYISSCSKTERIRKEGGWGVGAAEGRKKENTEDHLFLVAG